MLRCFKMCKFWVHFQNWNKQKQKWYICLVFEHTIVNTGKSILHNMQSLTLTLTKHRSAVPSTDMLQKWFLPLQSLFFPIQLGIIFYLERSWPRWRWTCRCCHRCSCRRRWTSWSPEQAQSNLRDPGDNFKALSYAHLSLLCLCISQRDAVVGCGVKRTEPHPHAGARVGESLQRNGVVAVCCEVLPEVPHLDDTDLEWLMGGKTKIKTMKPLRTNFVTQGANFLPVDGSGGDEGVLILEQNHSHALLAVLREEKKRCTMQV